ncbi:GNAT family N-acetyltransferase [Streptomyces venezuelae]|uniref:GNAT family N-acetyltransferase n=1 Tax=Streptomyces venezuelae TaxID=54571 RepID=A0A5P2CMR9_STRVZ|nr:GNAT family N-acetyltransferase [Streptomyces venezuelae]QES42441.1 GNAT family N-acetyltransferase [Streptomyces venezuelae]
MEHEYVVRTVRADEWPQVRELRLAALRDPAAPVAFLETYEEAAAKPDSFWQERAAGAASGSAVRQFVAEDADGVWVGSVTVLVEEAGADDVFGGVIEQRQAHVVGVFVRPEHRGSGATEALFDAAVGWAWGLDGLERVRLYVHEGNPRAQAFYRRFGFVRSGEVVPVPGDPSSREFELVLKRP